MENTNNQEQIITIADLDMLKQIIDVACSRGAFKGEELSQVGEVYNKVTAFLNIAVGQIQQQQQAASEEAQAVQEQQESQADNPQTQGE